MVEVEGKAVGGCGPMAAKEEFACCKAFEIARTTGEVRAREGEEGVQCEQKTESGSKREERVCKKSGVRWLDAE